MKEITLERWIKEKVTVRETEDSKLPINQVICGDNYKYH